LLLLGSDILDVTILRSLPLAAPPLPLLLSLPLPPPPSAPSPSTRPPASFLSYSCPSISTPLQSSEFTHLSFLKTQLSDILELLSETGKCVYTSIAFCHSSHSSPPLPSPSSPLLPPPPLPPLPSPGDVSGDQHVSEEGVKALECLIRSSPDKKRLLPLLELATTQEQAAINGYSKVCSMGIGPVSLTSLYQCT